MATAYQNHFLQRGRFNAGSSPNSKKRAVDPTMAAIGGAALKMAPVLAPYAKKLYNAYELNRANNYVDNLVSTGIADPSILGTGSVKNAYADSLIAAQKKKLNELVDTGMSTNYDDYLNEFGSRGLDPYSPYSDKTISSVPYSAAQQEAVDIARSNAELANYQYSNAGGPYLQGPSDIETMGEYAYNPATATPVDMTGLAEQVTPGSISYDGSIFGDLSSVNAGLDWNTPASFDYSGYYSDMPSSESLVNGNWGGDWGGSAGASAAADSGFGATFDAASGEWVGPATGTDGFGASWGDGFGGAATAGLFSAGSDLLSGKDINVGKAAGSAAGAYGGAALGTAVFPGVGTAVGGALGSMFGGALGGGGGDSIICGEWVKQGTFDKKTYNKLWKFVTKYYSTTMIRGYHVWATPVVNKMKAGSKTANYFTKKIFGAYVEEMLHVAGISEKGNLFGKFLKITCEPITWLVGRLSKRDPVNSRWDRRCPTDIKLQEVK